SRRDLRWAIPDTVRDGCRVIHSRPKPANRSSRASRNRPMACPGPVLASGAGALAAVAGETAAGAGAGAAGAGAGARGPGEAGKGTSAPATVRVSSGEKAPDPLASLVLTTVMDSGGLAGGCGAGMADTKNVPVPEPPSGTTTGWLAEVWEAITTGLFGTQATN